MMVLTLTYRMKILQDLVRKGEVDGDIKYTSADTNS